MAVDGTHGVGRALEVLSVYNDLGCNSFGLQETQRADQTILREAEFVVYCSGEIGGDGDKKGQGGVGLAVRTQIIRAASRPSESISDRLLKVTFELWGRARAVTFVVAYAPTETQDNEENHTFWTALDKVVAEVPAHEQLFVPIDTNARTGRRGGGEPGSESNKILDAYVRDEINGSGEHLLSFATNHDFSLVNTFLGTPKGAISHTFNGRGKKRIDYILTRQRDRKLVRNVTVHRQPSLHYMVDHNVVSAPVKLLGHFSRNRRGVTAVKPSIDRQRLTTDPDLGKEVAEAIRNCLRGNPPSGSSIDEVESTFTEAIMRTAE